MDMLCFFVALLFGGVFGRQDWISESEVRVTPGDNITLHCDCQLDTGVFILWYRNCSHRNQPSLIMRTQSRDRFKLTETNSEEREWQFKLKYFGHFELVSNSSSNTYDLMITNISDSEEGLYYCGTEQSEVKDQDKITLTYVHTFGNATKIILDLREPEPHAPLVISNTCWILLFSLCPLSAALSCLCSSLLFYHLCRKRGLQSAHQSSDTGGERRLNKDGDVCYAALDIFQLSQGLKKMENSDFSIYSACTYSAIKM
ncbi:unnamed protein product [Ophioblennius macclurei]